MGIPKPLTREQAPNELHKIFDAVQADIGMVPNLFGVVARFPAVITVMTRSPGTSQLCILRKVETLSTPAFVRVSDMNTSPRSSLSPTQYVIRSSCLLLLDLQGHLHLFFTTAEAHA